MVLGTRSTFEAALKKAARLRPQITTLGPARFLVNGSAGARYQVLITESGIECTCPAGSLGNPCYHGGWLYLVRIAAGLPVRALPTAAHASDSAPLAERSGLGVGMSRRWADDDDASLLDLFAKTA